MLRCNSTPTGERLFSLYWGPTLAKFVHSRECERGSARTLIKSCLILGLVVGGVVAPVHGALCILRNPDRDIFKLFPDASAYRTRIVNVERGAERLASMVEFLGQELDYDERGEHIFYEVLDGTRLIGVVRPHSERGTYGAVEVVWAFTPEGTIIDYLIQRSREKKTAATRSESFRRQFSGKTITDPLTVGDTKEINQGTFEFVPDGAEELASAIAYSAKKNLAIMKYFLLED